MSPNGPQRWIVGGVAALIAVITGWYVAEGSLALPSVLGAVLFLCILNRLLGRRVDALVAGVVVFGYLTGNRGFAQLHVPNVPLLPGEAVLLLGALLTFWISAHTKTVPLKRDSLNVFVVLWMLVATARLPLDVRSYGFMAVRDYAMVYYAAFFFLGQAWAADEPSRRWLMACLVGGLALCAPFFAAFDQAQAFFLTQATIGGIPLVYVKSDVAGGFMVGGTLWFAYRYAQRRQLRWLLWSAVALVGVGISNSRAALVALMVGIGWLLVLRGWGTLRVMGLYLLIGFSGLLIHAAATSRPLPETPLYRMYESVASVFDLRGEARITVESLADKPDNNQFRVVWWRTVIWETWDGGKWLGLGFGADLAEEFLRNYYGDAEQEFVARSPHNFLLSVFARTGLIGLVGFLGVMAAMVRRTWRAAQTAANDRETVPLWILAWTILTSACFGVVLEGPMAATIFWMALGLANANGAESEESKPTSPPGVSND